MSAEILILSGARSGERIVLDATEFRVGSEPNCDVLFDPRQDLAAKGRSVLIRLLDDGWIIVSCTDAADLFVNQTVISGRMRLRSGDVLRMSSEGPAFSFRIVSRTAATVPARGPDQRTAANDGDYVRLPAAAPAVRGPDPHPAAVKQGIAGKQGAAPPAGTYERRPDPRVSDPHLSDRYPAGQSSPASAAPPQAPAAVHEAAQPCGGAEGKTRWLPWATAVGGGLAVLALLACGTAYLMTPPAAAPDPKVGETQKNDGNTDKEIDALDVQFSAKKPRPREPLKGPRVIATPAIGTKKLE